MKKRSFSIFLAKSAIIASFFLLSIACPCFSANAKFNFAKDSGLSATGNKAGYNLAPSTPEAIAGQIILTALGLIGIVFLGFMIYAGVRWMTAAGNDQAATKAKEMITQAIIGLVIVIGAYAITYFVIKYFGGNSLA